MKYGNPRLASRTLFLVVSIAGIFGLGMSGLIYGWFFCYSCPYAVASCPIGIVEHSFVDMRLQGLWEGIQLLAYVVGLMSFIGMVSGRMACGWACPIGYLQDGVDWIRRKALPKTVQNALAFEGSKIKYVKYSFLLLIPLSSYIFIDTVYTSYCPVGGITGTIPTLILEPDSWETAGAFVIKMASVAFFLVLAAVFSRGWCRFLCPIGAFYSLFNRVSFLRFENDMEACVNCGLCKTVCQMGLDPQHEVQSAECIMCGKCADVCPKSSITLGHRFQSKKEVATDVE